ncbi:hypothetical protein JAAARDRAFT_37296 [Jaapia argillacea MUCL 33604]|uniref:Uncharacterized protein n=1 Tax=Jaapia argillacea MUCL 33604 TaxID=933084 RepID=A0A067PZU5_9AGAM|nr:hypothetical protein JAAARDRAFT_37296 [Jaapia argillacea MUCL 33604]
MGISFGGLGVMISHKPLSNLSFNSLVGNVELRSMFFAMLSLVVLLLLAYLTNPSESSFRAYLTEQSFRQHLSRLDDNNEDDRIDPSGTPYSVSRRNGSTKTSGLENISPVPFSSRASVSLRTPKHVFHSFGILTIAAVVPIGKSYRPAAERTHSDNFGGSMVYDTWFVGAFGKWWRGGVLESWWYDSIATTKDEEGCGSGIFDVKASDKSDRYTGLPFTTTAPPPRSPPRLRQRERPAQLPTRSSSPPPLPKSASLPLHATRTPSSAPDYRLLNGDRNAISRTPSVSSVAPVPLEQQCQGRLLPQSRSSSMMFDQSPIIADILRQINIAKSAVQETRSQLDELDSAASQSHAALQNELNEHRERKRQEDATRVDLRNRAKALEETKRGAEASKRDVEKKLRVAQNRKETANQRVANLDKEIANLKQRILSDQRTIQQTKDDSLATEKEMNEAMETKKREIKVAEDVISALNARAKELEERIASEQEHLREARYQAEIRKQDRAFAPLQPVVSEPEPASWPPVSSGLPEPKVTVTDTSGASPKQAEALVKGTSDPGHPSPNAALDRPRKLSLAGIANFNISDSANQLALRAKGYSIFDDDIASLNQSQRNIPSSTFSPFDPEISPSGAQHSPFTPTSSNLIPSSLIRSLEAADGSFRSDYDSFLEGEWNNSQLALYSHHSNGLTSSPTSLHGGPPDDEHDPFEVRPPPRDRERLFADTYSHMTVPVRTNSAPDAHSPEDRELGQNEKATTRRWFTISSKEKPRKGLNPDAKAFDLVHGKPFAVTHLPPTPAPSFEFDPLTPSGLVSSAMPVNPPSTTDSAFSTMSMRAFAPSREERQALQRILGTSSNASLERLPSLSNVGSLPPSPTNVPAVVNHPHHKAPFMGDFSGMPFRSWFHAWPSVRKPKFSPWDDEEPAEGTGLQSSDGV